MSARPIAWSIGSFDHAPRGLQAFDVECRAVFTSPALPQALDAQLAALAQDGLPAAIRIGMLGHAGDAEVLCRWIDRLRCDRPGLPMVVDAALPTNGANADAELLRACRPGLLARATLLCVDRESAAILLDGPHVVSHQDVESAASALREAGCAAVLIADADDSGSLGGDFVSAEFAQGWLTRPQGITHNGKLLAWSAAAAMALGFVADEAAVIASMAVAGPGKGLPALHASLAAQPLRFVPLQDPDLGLYAIVDSAAWIQRVLAAGVRTVQLRIKQAVPALLRREMQAAISAARAHNAQLFINDHWQLAIEEGAYGVHLGQEDLASADLRAIAEAGLRLGLSTHAHWEVARALAVGPSYIACGPIHPTNAKAMPWIAQGEDNLAYWCSLLPQPVVAIGGMNAERAAEAVRCGASGVAVIAAITSAAAPEAACAALQSAIGQARTQPRRSPPRMARPTIEPHSERGH